MKGVDHVIEEALPHLLVNIDSSQAKPSIRSEVGDEYVDMPDALDQLVGCILTSEVTSIRNHFSTMLAKEFDGGGPHVGVGARHQYPLSFESLTHSWTLPFSIKFGCGKNRAVLPALSE